MKTLEKKMPTKPELTEEEIKELKEFLLKLKIHRGVRRVVRKRRRGFSNVMLDMVQTITVAFLLILLFIVGLAIIGILG